MWFIVLVLLVLLAIFLPPQLSGGLKMELSTDGEYYVVKSCSKFKIGQVIIPQEYKGKEVREIGELAFSGCKLINEIVMPDTITNIDVNAFWDCGKLKTLIMSKSLKTIGATAILINEQKRCFNRKNDCYYLGTKDNKYEYFWGYMGGYAQEINIENGCRYIYSIAGMNAIRGNDNIVRVRIPQSVEMIRPGFCQGSDRDINYKIEVDVNNINYKISGKGLYTKDGKTLVYYMGARNDNTKLVDPELKLPKGLSVIEDYAFYGCTELKRFITPASVKHIGYQAFGSCGQLVTVEVGENVTYLGEYAFDACAKLKTVRIGVEYIRACTLNNCSSLRALELSKNVKEMAGNAVSSNFGDCYKKFNSIRFAGTKDEWLEKPFAEWNFGGYIREVICTDGTLFNNIEDEDDEEYDYYDDDNYDYRDYDDD